MKLSAPFTFAQLDAGCEERYRQDYRAEMGKDPPEGDYDAFGRLSTEEKFQERERLLRILLAMSKPKKRKPKT